jgi:hypothetical protein
MRYKLWKIMVLKTGLIVGINQYESAWVEVRLLGKKVAQWHMVNNDPSYLHQQAMIKDRRGDVMVVRYATTTPEY